MLLTLLINRIINYELGYIRPIKLLDRPNDSVFFMIGEWYPTYN